MAKHGSGAGIIAECFVYAPVPDLLVAIDASGVDAQKDCSAGDGHQELAHLGRSGDAAVYFLSDLGSFQVTLLIGLAGKMSSSTA